jgi:hypothetical protein
VADPAIRRELLAFASHCPPMDYCQGLNFIVGHALRWASEADALALLTALLHRLLPPHYYDHGLAGAARDQSVLAEMLLQAVPGTLEALARMAGNLPGPPPPSAGAGKGKGKSAAAAGAGAGGGGAGGATSPPPPLSTSAASSQPPPVDAGVLLSSGDSITGMTLKWFMCLFTIPFHACFTDRVWDALCHEGVPQLHFGGGAPRALAAPAASAAGARPSPPPPPQPQQQRLTAAIYWP